MLIKPFALFSFRNVHNFSNFVRLRGIHKSTQVLKTIRFQILNIYRIKAVQYSLKALLMLLLVGLLYMQLLGSAERLPWEELQAFWQNRFGWPHLLAIGLVVLFMPLNWLLETKKWLHLMQTVESINLLKAFKAVLAGLTVSMFTPNRMGEYGGRVLLVQKENRIRSVFATLVGSMSQWIVLVAGGLIGLLYLMLTDLIPTNYMLYAWLVFAVGLFACSFVTFCYFHLSWFSNWARKWRWTSKWAGKLHEDLFQHYQYKALAKALRISAFRYLVYAAQYFFLLACFGFDMNWGQGFAAILFVFLLQTGLPIPPSAGLIARGSIAVWVFGWFVVGEDSALGLQSAVLASTFTLWLINLLLPAAFGAFFIVQNGLDKNS
jgi:hypothetical protein